MIISRMTMHCADDHHDEVDDDDDEDHGDQCSVSVYGAYFLQATERL